MTLIVYGGSLSPFVRKVCVVMAEKGVDFKVEQVNPFAPPPEFLEISPLKRIPVLRDTDQPEPNTLSDSSVICDYIEHKFPNPPLYPKDPFLRARALWYEEYADSILAATIGPGLFFQRVVKKMMKQQPDETICAATMSDKLPPLFDYLEKEIGDRQYLVGDAFSIADVTVGTMLVNFAHAGETVDAKRWPKLAAYGQRLHERPSFKGFIEKERPLVQRFRAA
ncbi:MAG TPA: glutathione S-transferase family protein [Rhizomicrobium sp.]|jgi:glutathione S-transferase